MITALNSFISQSGLPYKSLKLWGYCLILFPENNLISFPLYAEGEFILKTNELAGDICLSRLDKHNNYEYSKIGRWSKNESLKIYVLYIEGKGVFRFNYSGIITEKVNVTEMLPKNPKTKSITSFDFNNYAIKDKTFNPDNFPQFNSFPKPL